MLVSIWRIALVGLLLLSLWFDCSIAVEVFVNGVSGSDANTGLQPTGAVATIGYGLSVCALTSTDCTLTLTDDYYPAAPVYINAPAITSFTLRGWSQASHVPVVNCSLLTSSLVPAVISVSQSTFSLSNVSSFGCGTLVLAGNSSVGIVHDVKVRASRNAALLATTSASLNISRFSCTDSIIMVVERACVTGLDQTTVVNITDSRFERNYGIVGVAVRAGGVLTMRNVLCSGNVGSTQGNCVQVSTPDGMNGVVIDHLTCIGNTALLGVCVLVDNQPWISITNSYFANNTATQTAAGVQLILSSLMQLANLTFDGNSCGSGPCSLSILPTSFASQLLNRVPTIYNIKFVNHVACQFFVAQLGSPVNVDGMILANTTCNDPDDASSIAGGIRVMTSAYLQMLGANDMETVIFTDSVFEDNHLPTLGALVIDTPSAFTTRLIRCRFSRNSASVRGSAINVVAPGDLSSLTNTVASSLIVMASIFEDNACSGTETFCPGGAVSLGSAGSTKLSSFSDSVFVRNTAFVGGALFARRNVALTNVLFENNTASRDGGALVMNEALSGLTCTNCTFTSNFAVRFGGALQVVLTSAQFTSSAFLHNQAGADGGAAFFADTSSLDPAPVTWQDCQFVANQAGSRGSGGAIYVAVNYIMDFYGGLFERNVASYSCELGLGGCLYVAHSDVNFYGTHFLHNVAVSTTDPSSWGRGGCIFIDSRASVRLRDAVLDHNDIVAGQLRGLGGTIFSIGALFIENTTISNSGAWEGGGVYLDSGGVLATVSDSFFFNMSAFDGGAAIYFQDSSNGFSVSNTVFDGFGGTPQNPSMTGGATCIVGSGAVFTGCAFRNGHDIGQGGAFYAFAPVTVTSSTFENIVVAEGGAVIFMDTSLSTFTSVPVLPWNVDAYRNNVVTDRGAVIAQYGTPPLQSPTPSVFSDLFSRLSPMDQGLEANGNRAVGVLSMSSPVVSLTLFIPDSPSGNIVSFATSDFNIPTLSVFPGEFFSLQVYLYDAFKQIMPDANGIAMYLYCSSQYFDSAPPKASQDCILTGAADAVSSTGSAQFVLSVSSTYASTFFLYASTSATAPESSADSGIWSQPIQVSLLSCPPGTRLGSTSCISCGDGEYSITYNAELCYQCEEFESDNRAGCTVTRDSVFSKSGYYVTADSSANGKAIVFGCRENQCTGSKAKDFKRSVATPSGIVELSSLAPGETFNLCRRGQQGFLCASCIDEWAKWGSNCVDCSHGSPGIIVAYIIIGIFYVAFQHVIAQTSGARFKIVVSFVQLVIALQQDSAIAIFNFRLQTGDLCPFYRSELSIFWIDLVVPLVLFVIQFFYYIAAITLRSLHFHHRFRRQSVRMLFRSRAFLRSTLMLFLVCYSSITSLAVQYLNCKSYPTGQTVLWLESAVSCNDPEYVNFIRPVAICLLVLGLSVPFIFAAILFSFKRRGALIPAQLVDQVPRSMWTYALGPLFESYQHKYFWYESVLLLRRILFYALPVLFWTSLENSYPNITPLLSTVLAVSFLAIHIRVEPFARSRDNLLETIALFTLIILTTIVGFQWANGDGPQSSSPLYVRVLFWTLFVGVLVGMCVYLVIGLYQQLRDRFLSSRSRASAPELSSPHSYSTFVSRRESLAGSDDTGRQSDEMQLAPALSYSKQMTDVDGLQLSLLEHSTHSSSIQ